MVNLYFISLLATQALAGFSPSYWGFKTAENSPSITSVSTILQVPTISQLQGLFLWPGLGTEDNYLVQSIITNGGAYVSGRACHSKGNQWCGLSFSFSGFHPSDGAPGTIVHDGDLINITYTYDPVTRNMTQLMTLQSTNSLLSTLSTTTGPGGSFHARAECHGWNSGGNTPPHSYFNTTFGLSAPDSAFASRATPKGGSTADDLTTSDGGRTWSVPEIRIAASTCVDAGKSTDDVDSGGEAVNGIGDAGDADDTDSGNGLLDGMGNPTNGNGTATGGGGKTSDGLSQHRLPLKSSLGVFGNVVLILVLSRLWVWLLE